MASEERSAHKAQKKADKAQKKADKKQYERNHAQLKRQQAFHGALLAAQVKRNKKAAKRAAG
ncbi:MAG TPA: hypothetical protein VGF80_15700 [Galbitalea sp.]